MVRRTTNLLQIMVFTLIGYLPVAANAGWNVSTNQGEVSFEAIGRPAMIKIHGQSKTPPQCNFSIENKNLVGSCTLNLDSLDTGIETRNKHMKENYLMVAKFPKAQFTLQPVVLPTDFAIDHFQSGKISFQATLDLHGEKKNMGGDLSFSSENKKATITSNFKIKISDFAIPKPAYAGISMAEEVSVQATASGNVTSK